jgi:hypothetical protein
MRPKRTQQLNPAAASRDTPAGDLRGQVSGLPRNWTDELPWLPLAPSASSAAPSNASCRPSSKPLWTVMAVASLPSRTVTLKPV